MPTQERRWRHEKQRPADARQASARSRQEQSVGRPKRRLPNVTAQDRQLVAEHDDLEVLRLSRSELKEDKLQDAEKDDVNNGQEHGTSVTERAVILHRSNYRTPQVGGHGDEGMRGQLQWAFWSTA